MKRNLLVVGIAAVAGIIIFLNPLQYFRARPARPVVDPAVISPLAGWAGERWRSPEDYVTGAFAAHQVVFLGEFGRIRQDVQLAAALMPRLHAAGVRVMGIEYALSEDQGDIDRLVGGPRWDEAKAREILFNCMVTWGYQEYVGLFKAAWSLNRGIAQGAPQFRILGLGVRQDWGPVHAEKDLKNPAVVAQIFAAGTPDAHMAAVIEDQLVSRGEKALIFCKREHILTRFRVAQYERYITSMHLGEARLAAAIINDRIGGRAFSICLHAPWLDPSKDSGLAWAAGGVIDALIAALPPEKQSAGWDLAGTPLGRVPVNHGAYGEGATGLTLSDLYDGYIVQGPLGGYAAVSPIRDFVRPEDAERAARNYPGPKPPQFSAQQVNESIADGIQNLTSVLAQFK